MSSRRGRRIYIPHNTYGGIRFNTGDPDKSVSPMSKEKTAAILNIVEQEQQQRKERKIMKKKQVVEKRVTALTLAADLDELVKTSADTYLAARSGSMADTLALAVATAEIEKALTAEIIKPLMSLQGKPFGFMCDKQYPEAVVKQCAVQALIQGVPMAGNCINIIAGRAYVTKEGFTFLIDEIQAVGGISHFKYDIGLPHGHEVRGKTSKGNDIIVAKVQATASWKQNGVKQEISTTFPCKGDAWSSEDSYQGKAERKLKRKCFERMKGIAMAVELDIDDDDEDFELNDLETADVQEEAPVTEAQADEPSDSPPDDEPMDSQEVNERTPEDIEGELFRFRRDNLKAFAFVCSELDINPSKINHLTTEQQEVLLSELKLSAEQ